MSTYHPRYGKLLTSREVSDLTGFTLNQLRYQRQNPDQAELPFVKQKANSFYRESDVLLWLEENGGVEEEYVVAGKSKATPLVNPTVDRTRLANIAELAKITTKNAWGSHGTWLTERSGLPDPYNKVNAWAKELWNLHREQNPDAEEFMPLHKSRIDNPLQYWPAITWAVRRATAYVRGWEVSDQEIMDIPVGEVPPSKVV